MDLDHLLSRCRAYEQRAAAAYRAFAARTRPDPEVCAMWTALAREEEQHAGALSRAAMWLDRAQGWQTFLEGWDEALAEIEQRLRDAESPEIGADVDRQLLAALALERTEMETLFHRLLRASHTHDPRTAVDGHVGRLITLAEQRSTSHAVQLEVALLRAHNRLEHAS